MPQSLPSARQPSFSAVSAPSTLPLRRARDLLDQQLWCVGRDILHADGNALLRYGFERVRPPPGETGSSAYVLPLREGGHCVLWGFAVFCGSPALGVGMLLRRHPFAARLAHTPTLPLPLWRAEQLPTTAPARTPDTLRLSCRLGASLARTLAAYERWALTALGDEHRARCEAERPRAVRRRQTIPCTGLATAWEQFAARADVLAAAAAA